MFELAVRNQTAWRFSNEIGAKTDFMGLSKRALLNEIWPKRYKMKAEDLFFKVNNKISWLVLNKNCFWKFFIWILNHIKRGHKWYKCESKDKLWPTNVFQTGQNKRSITFPHTNVVVKSLKPLRETNLHNFLRGLPATFSIC